MAKTTITRNDTSAKFSDTLTIGGSAINLTGATVRFHMRNEFKAVDQAATIVSAAAGTVEYQPVAADVNLSGTYDQEWEITFADSRILSVPNASKNTIVIIDDLD